MKPSSAPDVTDSPTARPVVACSELVGMRRGYDIICLAPEGFSSRKVANIRQAMCQVEMLLETGATKIGIYAQSGEAQPNEKAQRQPPTAASERKGNDE